MSETLIRALFPKEYREFRHKRLVIVLLRSAHIMCFSIVVGGYYFGQDKALILNWFIGTMLSGLSMFLIDMYGSCIILFEIRGISILLKLFLLSWLPVLSQTSQIVLLITVIALSSYISHTTASVRHKNILPLALLKKFGLE